MGDDKKWSLKISATVEDSDVSPELKLANKIDDNQSIELKLDKDKIYAEYDLKF